jgi:mono/diheme cytochrome c family protein
MVLNLIYWLIVVAVAGFFGWLTWRAARAKSWFVKIPGVLLAGVLTLVLLFVAFVSGKGLATFYLPGGDPAPNLKVEGTTEQIARGKYIAYIACAGCHGTNGEFPLKGGTDLATEIPMPIGSLVASNLTPGGVLKNRTDGELYRVLRHGVAKDGSLSIFMSFMPYRELSDDDTKAVIAYLRTQPAVETPTNGGDDPNLLAAILFGAEMFPNPAPLNKSAITAPAKGVNAEYGKYVATFGECRGCHGPNMTGSPPNPAQPDGVPNPRPMVATWSRDQFVQTMRTGVRPSGVKFRDVMPWKNASRMDDQDLSALYEYIKKAP